VPLDDPQIEFGSLRARCFSVLAFAQRGHGRMRALGASVVASWWSRDEFLNVTDPDLSSPNSVMLLTF
jgi:alpha-beta hydrolase superfamily lysophospholipase